MRYKAPPPPPYGAGEFAVAMLLLMACFVILGAVWGSMLYE